MTKDEHPHPSEEELFDCSEQRASSEVNAHVAGCVACASVVSDYRDIAAAARNPETWRLADEIMRAAASDTIAVDHLQVIRRVAALKEAEDAQASALLAGKLESPFVFAYANILRQKRYYTGGVVRLLCATAWDQLDRNALFAKMLALTAAVIADALPDDYYPARAVEDLRGTSWLYFASACGNLNKFRLGHLALRRAERAFRRLPLGDVQIGRAELTRAILFYRQGDDPEAVKWARAAGDRFLRQRDFTRYSEARESEAVFLQRLGDQCGAREALEQVQRAATDPDVKARVTLNLAINCREAGDLAAATQHFANALQYYEAAGNESMFLRTRWSIARLALVSGAAAEAERQLRPIAAQLAERGQLWESAYARLDLITAMLSCGKHDQVIDECEQLIAHFSKAEILTGALTALAFMKEAAAQRKLAVDDVDHVQRYMKAVKTTPSLRFLPLPRRDD